MENKWHIDQAIICINDSNRGNLPVVKGMKYIINDIRICPTCGMMEFKLSIPHEGTLVCIACKTELEPELTDCWWAEHWRFAPLETFKKENKNLNINLEPKKIIKELNIISN